MELPPSVGSSSSDSIELPNSVSSEPPNDGLSDSDQPFTCATGHAVLPPDVDPENCNAFDEAGEEFDDLCFWETDELGNCNVPSPPVTGILRDPHWFAEFFSPPRIGPRVARNGRRALLSLDLKTCWDFTNAVHCNTGLEALSRLKIQWLGTSPPCTIFSDLQRLFNMKKIDPAVWQQRWDMGMQLLGFTMACIQRQIDEGRFFFFEHPARATSWKTDVVMQIARQEVWVAEFDQCRFGLRSKVLGLPMRKRTKIMTNSRALADKLRDHYCLGCPKHQCIMGSEGGISRALWAQRYPDGLIDVIVQVVCDG